MSVSAMSADYLGTGDGVVMKIWAADARAVWRHGGVKSMEGLRVGVPGGDVNRPQAQVRRDGTALYSRLHATVGRSARVLLVAGAR